MLTPEEVACNFIPVFFERLASNPAELAGLYGEHSSFMVVDFEYGNTEAVGIDVPRTVEQWAEIMQGCDISVESYSAVPFYSGVSVYVTMSAETKTIRHYFQLVTLLEAYSTVAYGSTGYYIRHQIAIRPGAAEKEQSVVEVAPPQPDAKLEAIANLEPVVETVETQPHQQQQQQTKKQKPKQEQEQQEKKVTEEAKTTKNPSSSDAAASTTASADKRLASKPKSWASLASTAPRGEQRQPMKVKFHENGVNVETADATVKAAAQQENQVASPKTHSKTPRVPATPIGDRLMFNIDYVVSDEEIKLALGPLAAHIVSLRNNSANGHVFLDFSDKEKVIDVLKANPPTVGSRKTRMNIYRQRARQ